MKARTTYFRAILDDWPATRSDSEIVNHVGDPRKIILVTTLGWHWPNTGTKNQILSLMRILFSSNPELRALASTVAQSSGLGTGLDQKILAAQDCY